MKIKISPENHIKLFNSLPHQFKTNTTSIQAILSEFGNAKLTDENFEAIYQRVQERLIEDSDQAELPCIDCYRSFELKTGASNVRCQRCNQIYLSRLGQKGDWHTWVYGGAQNPSESQRH